MSWETAWELINNIARRLLSLLLINYLFLGEYKLFEINRNSYLQIKKKGGKKEKGLGLAFGQW